MRLTILLSLFVCSTLAAPSNIEDPIQLLSVGNRKFTAAVYKEILKTNKGNLIFSPFSVETVLALTSDGAKGDTRKELVGALYLPESQEKIQQQFKEILPKLSINTEEAKLLAANKIYVADGVKLEEEFKKIAVEVYNSGIENINFANNEEAANTINKWVEQQTNDKIKDLVGEDCINGDTALLLVNALYLSAEWLNPFSDDVTHDEKFYKNSNESIEIPTMFKIDSFKYSENTELNAQFVELKYVTSGLSMIIILPNKTDGLTSLENNIDKVFEPQNLTYETVDLQLPKFTINSQIKFVDILKSLGVKKIFEDADLSGLSSNRKNLYVSDVIQKAFINVTESGTEAAAATAEFIETRMGHMYIGEPKKFQADHPFIYLIKYNDLILFAGKYNP